MKTRFENSRIVVPQPQILLWGFDGSDPSLQHLQEPGDCISGKLCPSFIPPRWGSTPAHLWQVSAVLPLALPPAPRTARHGTVQPPCAGQAALLMAISCNGKLQSHSFPSGLMGTAGITRLPRPSHSGFPAAPEPAGSRLSFIPRETGAKLVCAWTGEAVHQRGRSAGHPL